MIKGNIHFDTTVDKSKSLFGYTTSIVNNYAYNLLHMRLNQLKAPITCPNFTPYNNQILFNEGGPNVTITIPPNAYTMPQLKNELLVQLNASTLAGTFSCPRIDNDRLEFDISSTVAYDIDTTVAGYEYGFTEGKYMCGVKKVSATLWTFYNCKMYHSTRIVFNLFGIADSSKINDSFNVGSIISNAAVYIHHIEDPRVKVMSVDTAEDISDYIQKDIIFPNPKTDMQVRLEIVDDYGRSLEKYQLAGETNNDWVYMKFDIFKPIEQI